MGFPFTIKRSPDTVYYWEKNDWFRKNGYNIPLSPYLIMQWICLITFDFGFFYFLVNFLTVYDNNSILGTTETPFEYLYQDWKKANSIHIDPFSTWSCKIMLGLSTLVKFLSVTTSMIETEDPVVTSQRGLVTRSQTYVRRYGIPVIDSFSGICNICRVKVSKNTRHCKLCNKCIDRMDHHCKWLNCCIGKSNYRLFMALVISAFSALLWYSYMALYVSWTCFYKKNVYMVHAFQLFEMKDYHVDEDQMYYICAAITVIITILVTVSFVAITRLLVFHIKIATMNMTTIEYLNMAARNDYNHSSIFDSDDDDYYYSDSDLSDENYTTVHKKSLYPQSQWPGNRYFRLVTHKLRRTWILIARTVVPNYKYRRLANSKQTCTCCLITIKKPQLLPTSSNPRKKHRIKRDTSRSNTRDNVNMEEFFATKTIRPIITLDEEEYGGSGPDYDDDMGLDLTVLNDFSGDDEHEARKKKPVSNRGSKAARLLDLSEEDTLAQIQNEQQQLQQHLQNQPDLSKSSKEDDELYTL